MQRLTSLLISATLLAIASVGLQVTLASAQAKPTSVAKTTYSAKKAFPTTSDVEALGQTWGAALASRDPKSIAALYDEEAVLLATFTNELDTSTEIFDYFVGLTKRNGLNVKFDQQNIRVLDEDTASNSGLYTFSYVEKGKTVFVPARYTFLYEKRGDRWVIVEHHSSVQPQK